MFFLRQLLSSYRQFNTTSQSFLYSIFRKVNYYLTGIYFKHCNLLLNHILSPYRKFKSTFIHATTISVDFPQNQPLSSVDNLTSQIRYVRTSTEAPHRLLKYFKVNLSLLISYTRAVLVEIHTQAFGAGFYYLQGFSFLLFIDACLTDDEPLWEPIE